MAEVEDRVGDIFKGLSESVKGEMAANKSTLEVMILNEVREREAKDEELRHQMEKDKIQIRDDLDQKYKLQEQQRAGKLESESHLDLETDFELLPRPTWEGVRHGGEREAGGGAAEGGAAEGEEGHRAAG